MKIPLRNISREEVLAEYPPSINQEIRKALQEMVSNFHWGWSESTWSTFQQRFPNHPAVKAQQILNTLEEK